MDEGMRSIALYFKEKVVEEKPFISILDTLKGRGRSARMSFVKHVIFAGLHTIDIRRLPQEIVPLVEEFRALAPQYNPNLDKTPAPASAPAQQTPVSHRVPAPPPPSSSSVSAPIPDQVSAPEAASSSENGEEEVSVPKKKLRMPGIN